ncbi:class I SAM-dependent methyltransferase [Fulvivirgaceae bacterium BMA10]|uniref:Class I SAM-dependent methyltransferase n=1 Tax=Splendidivirga corallicola TaxID=3051826 RepID=A0ABT8KGM0_9BACT|nr:class I SAM-dependent methyltransferase [Fulvivirgaceae bacterium BMA10]
MTAFKDHFSDQSDIYAKYRPSYPKELFEYLASVSKQHNKVWDCGTGNGQAAIALAEYFKTVIATDPSVSQIKNAQPGNNITYHTWPAEKTDIDESSVDLITVAQAIHWFDFKAFYKEVKRVATKEAFLAVWTYSLIQIDPVIDKVISKLYSDILGNYWPKERRYVDEAYKTIPFPFIEIATPSLQIKKIWSKQDLLQYLMTWSSTQRYVKKHEQNPIAFIIDELNTYWNDKDEKQVYWDLHIRTGKIH